jgi:hypothetical protein
MLSVLSAGRDRRMNDDLPRPRSEEQGDREGAARAFVHPADAIEPMFGGELQESHLELLSAKVDAVDIFRRILIQCMPPAGAYRGGRRWKAGYNRMVAFAWLAAPEIFVGMTEADVAQSIGISRRMFCTHLATLRTELAARDAVTKRTKKRIS